jgi:hypothetical protein
MLAGVGLLTAQGAAQSISFDFDNAPPHSGLPINLTVGGITAQFSATGQGFSIQPANTQGFTPAGFSGNCIYPNSVFAADLLVGFSQTLTDFSILYAPQELGCDDSATMRVTANMNGAFVGTSTTTASAPGTWPSATLSFSSALGFNSLVVHYDARPPTCQDWGPVFMADNMTVTPAPPAIILTHAAMLASGVFQFAFTNTPALSFSVLGTTNLSVPFSNWTVLGVATETSAGQFQFANPQTTNSLQRFYRVRSP